MSEPVKMGRPKKPFDENYCNLIIEHCAKGYSIESFAGKIGISKDTLYSWFKEYEHFSDAKKEAIEASRLHWETLGIEHCLNKTVIEEFKDENGKPVKKMTVTTSLNTGVWVFNMKNRFRDEWKDKHEVEPDPNGKGHVFKLNYERKGK